MFRPFYTWANLVKLYVSHSLHKHCLMSTLNHHSEISVFELKLRRIHEILLIHRPQRGGENTLGNWELGRAKNERSLLLFSTPSILVSMVSWSPTMSRWWWELSWDSIQSHVCCNCARAYHIGAYSVGSGMLWLDYVLVQYTSTTRHHMRWHAWQELRWYETPWLHQMTRD